MGEIKIGYFSSLIYYKLRVQYTIELYQLNISSYTENYFKDLKGNF